MAAPAAPSAPRSASVATRLEAQTRSSRETALCPNPQCGTFRFRSRWRCARGSGEFCMFVGDRGGREARSVAPSSREDDGGRDLTPDEWRSLSARSRRTISPAGRSGDHAVAPGALGLVYALVGEFGERVQVAGRLYGGEA